MQIYLKKVNIRSLSVADAYLSLCLQSRTAGRSYGFRAPKNFGGFPHLCYPRTFVAEFVDAQKEFAWLTGGLLSGFVVSRRADEWSIVVKARVGGFPMVGFTGARFWDGIIPMFLAFIQTRNQKFYPDKYAR